LATKEGAATTHSKDFLKKYLSILANLTLIILFSEMLNFFLKIVSSKSKNIVKESNGYLRIFHLLK